MAETEKTIEAMEKEVSKEVNEASVNPQADAPKKNAVAAEPMKSVGTAEDLGPAVVKPSDSNPDATKKISKVSDKVSQSAQVGSEPSHLKATKEETEKSSDEKEAEKKEDTDAEDKKEVKKETYDVKADVDALVGDSDLSEEFRQKAATIFEAAIKAKVKEEQTRLQGEYETKLKEDTEKSRAELVTKVDSYLNYVVEEWMEDNKIAIERGVKGEIAEDFISGLKKLFEDHYIDVPDEKYDVLEDQAQKIKELEGKLNEQIDKNVELNKDNGELKRADIIADAANELTDVDKEKFNKLAEEVEFTKETDFATKVKTLKESYFGKAEKAKTDDIDDVAVSDGSVQPFDLSKSMAAYTTAISKTKDIKIGVK